MGDSIEALIPKTQELLQPLIAKPKLADKLLLKPPFRFLHDIFAALTQATGFAKGLYNDFELDSANMKEKNQKITYLDKMVVCVGQCLGRDIDVRPAKIVAGLEPENTNLFLQALAQAASNKSLDWAGAVQKTLAKIPSLTADGAPAAAAPAPAESKASAPAAAEQPAAKERPSSSEAEKAAAEVKAKEKARKEKEEAEADRKNKEQKAEAAAAARAAKPAEPKAAASEASDPKSGANLRSSSSSSSRGAKAPPDNNKETDGSLTQQINECNGDVERTKEVIEKIIQRPKMAAKLLSKPPFRFIHDIVSEITRATGFADGLYGADELDSASIKEKQPKIDYLTKIIQCVSCQLNVEVDAKPAKIVAGLEPDDTNKFLQLLGIACRVGSSADAVQRVLAGDTAVRASSAAKKASGAGAASSKAGEREPTPEAKLSSRSTTPLETKSRPVSKEGEEGTSAPGAAAAAAGAGTFGGPMKPLALKSEDEENEENTNLRFNSESKDNGDEHPSAPGTSGGGGLGTSRTSRPTTARRRPPKLKENVTEVGRLMVHDTKVAPVAGIMKDGDNGDSDDDANADDNNPSGGGSASLLHDEGGGGAHGKLVRDILKDQSADEAARKQREDEDSAATNEAETGIRLGRRKKSFKDKSKSGASSLAEMNELRSTIQKICQATNPVGKGVEFVHEDLDAMSKELEQWKNEYAKKREQYEDERKKTEEALQPLQLQLLEVDELIKEQVHKINSLKATIAKNEDKTQKLLHMVVSA
ncbi:hypothetical protein PybrP1_011188 [[Pythium] brassicae (nom. inval.)]|nr:hypothetical protein PybrP1_011188 [[Pythium] brassicae (nom. inval.)]